MYRNFFALSELPFSISPDPKFLFMSDRHKEALAHLTYGLAETGGFALLTGEVGTGKTTVSRCLMEQLPENTQVAFILNPTLSSKELLATLCDELKIRYRKSDATAKILTDKIADKLLKNHENDINTLLIIDEAQHLEAEVLEQLRLLTNLETNTKKLLQVILIGQPELQQLLQRRDLRQLAQRITARYHLLPLTKQELQQYISHRLFVADCTRQLFSNSAIAKLHQLSQGIPRLVNLLCHQSLLLAFNKNESVVSKKTVLNAASQVLGEDIHSKTSNSAPIVTAVAVAGGLFTVLVAGFWWGQGINQQQAEEVAQESINSKAITPQVEVASTEVSSLINEQAKAVVDATEQLGTTAPGELRSNRDKVNTSTADKIFAGSESTNQQVQQQQLLISADKQPLPEIAQQTSAINKVAPAAKTRLVQQDLAQKDMTSPDLAEVEEVSPELLALFNAAVEANPLVENTQQIEQPQPEQSRQIKPLTQMPNWVQQGVPSLSFEQHIYASDGQGWVTVNGRDRYQGDMINADLQVSEILPQQVILSYQGQLFSLPALTNW
ncbi:AAA family ATPase [Litorilituus sediminis]|uniref:General secretion pathway protein GspA n=1 Tax=Litorilituus sediminis TaxID=718192 RepID=A0A4P6P362_9GAMM|nr:AAA family ATPase [Litorilituus sediminis]QBG35654.1 general secretion pathway protein GspA [Litorilituus sediminis]